MAGAKRSFSHLEVFLAFLSLQNPVARASLMEQVGVGEGAMRSILGVLKEKGLIVSTAKGHEFTQNGREVYNKILNRITIPQMIGSRTYPGLRHAAMVLKRTTISSPLFARDAAIAQGAIAALVLSKKEKLVAQGIDNVFEDIDEQINPMEGDVVLVAVGVEEPVIRKAVISMALCLSEDLEGLANSFC